MLRFSRMMDLQSVAPAFRLPDGTGVVHDLATLAQGRRGVLVAFLCNHCPFVRHLAAGLALYAQDHAPRGLQVIGISSNDVDAHPEDGPAQMVAFAREQGFGFPYLYDETQQTALDYGAICTPDFFLFDASLKLVYRGQFDESRPRTGHPPLPGAPVLRTDRPVTGADLRRATEALLSGALIPQTQYPSAGCSIKWKADREPAWA